MIKEASQLLEEFKDLPESEKRIFTAEFFRLALPYDWGPIEDDEIGQAARSLFALLDRGEDGAPTKELSDASSQEDAFSCWRKQILSV
jgi:hypothetical protein